MALKIHDIYPTNFTTRHDVGLAFSGSGEVYLAWLHYDRDTDADGDLMLSTWISVPYQAPQWEPPDWIASDAKTGPGIVRIDTDVGFVVAYGTTKDQKDQIHVKWFGSSHDETVLEESTNDRPSLAFFDHRLWLAWTGTDGRLNTINALDKVNFDPKTLITHQESSNDSPGLASDGVHLGIAWSGTDDRRSLNIAHVGYDSFFDKHTLTEYNGCMAGPALCTRDEVFYTAWGSAGTREIAMVSGLWHTPSDEINPEQTQHGPGIEYPYIAWVDENYVIQFAQFS